MYKKNSTQNSTQRTQVISYELVRSGKLTTVENALINYIGTFSQECRFKLSDIARGMQKSTRTVQRAINGLLKKGLINRRYTLFKRCVLSLASLEIQIKFAKNGLSMIKSILNFSKKNFKNKKNPTKSSDVTSMSDHDVTSMSCSTREKTLKNKTKNIVKFSSIFEQKNEKKRVDYVMSQLAKYKEFEIAQKLGFDAKH